MLVLLLTSESSGPRTWREAEGGREVEAELIGFEDGQVRLRLKDGRTAAAHLSRFSRADQEYVLRWHDDRQSSQGRFRNIESTLQIEGRRNPSKQLALLIGINRYDHAQDLNYCTQDAIGLHQALLAAGFEDQDVTVLTDDENPQGGPTKVAIEREIDSMLGGYDLTGSRVTSPGRARVDDVVVVCFSGHGVLVDGKSY